MPHPLLALSAARSVSQLIPTALVGVLYARRAHTLEGEGRGVPRWRQVCFYAGLVTATAAILALDHAASVSLYWRVVQLLLVGDVATLLIVLGLNAAIVAPLMRTRVMQRLRVLSNPPLAFALWTANVYVWLLSPLYSGALEHDGIRALQDLCFVVFGVNMWICLLGPLPMGRWFGDGAKALYILAVRIGAVVLANLFLWSGRVFSPFYTQSDGARHLSPLADQNIAGAIILGEAVLVTLGLFAWLYWRTLRDVEAPARVFDFDRELIREFSQPTPRPRRAPAPARAGEPRRRRFQPEADPAPALAQREALDSR
jgi:cytochrome c oxidase assembly factor CtaG